MKSFDHIEEIVIDPTFRAWVLRDDEQAKQHWLEYLNKYPEKKEMVEAARQILTEMVDLKYKMSDRTLEQSWETIASNLDSYSESSNQQTEDSRYRITNYWYAVAATFVGILMITSLWLFLGQTSLQTYQTAYGETKEILLSDSSIVVLNANSKIQFDKHNFLQHREVQIDGEAYFDIKKQRDETGNASDFEVSTGNVAVKVLGTRFNVSTRRENTSIVLEEGKVKLELLSLNVGELYMEPGEMVTYEHKDMKFKKSIVKPEVHMAWKENKLIFEDTPVQEIIQQLEDNYGIDIELQNEEVAKKRYTGTFHDPEPEIILFSLKTLFNLTEERKYDQIILK